MAIRTRLTIEEQSFDVLRCRYNFSRNVDSKGCPMGGMQGGEIEVELESDLDTTLLEYLLTKEPRAHSGSLEVWDEKEQQPIRTIAWDSAYIYAAGEAMQQYSSVPMTLKLAISPLRLDINRTIRIDRRFPQTSAFWWEEYKPEESPAVAGATDKNFTITDAYWLDDSGNQIRDLNVDTPVTLYVVLGQYTVGSSIELKFEDVDEAGEWKVADYTGTVGDDGVVVVENFKLEAAGKKEEDHGEA